MRGAIEAKRSGAGNLLSKEFIESLVVVVSLLTVHEDPEDVEAPQLALSLV